MTRASDRRAAAEREALEARYLEWHLDRVAEDRAESAVIPAEFRCLIEPQDVYPNRCRRA